MKVFIVYCDNSDVLCRMLPTMADVRKHLEYHKSSVGLYCDSIVIFGVSDKTTDVYLVDFDDSETIMIKLETKENLEKGKDYDRT